MPSITTWNRIESATRPTTVASGLEARLHDPLWMLGRQWQMQEFSGQDAGSPVEAAVTIEALELTHYFASGAGRT
jgi:hypothetical protein